MARIVALPVTDTLLDFPSEETAAEPMRPRVSASDRPRPSLVRGAGISRVTSSRDVAALRPEASSGGSRSERPAEPSAPDGGYSEFIRILGRGDV